MNSTTVESKDSQSQSSLDRRNLVSVDIRQGDHPEIPTPIPGLLEGRVTLLAGAGGSGKTTLTEQLVRHLSSKFQLGSFDLPENPVGAWCVYLEDNESMAQDRSLRVAGLGDLEEDRTGESNVRYLMGRDWNIPALREELEQARDDETLPGVIMLDHLRILIGSQPAGVSPNDWERRNLLRLMDIAEEFGVHIVVLTHMNKSGTVSGTTELINSVDTAYVIEPCDDRNHATLKCHKMRLAPERDFALSKKANGTWGFDDEIYVSETLAVGIARDILAVLRTQGPKTLAQLCMHPAVSGQRDAIRQALTRAKRRGWVASRAGHWEAVLSEGDKALRPATECAICGLHMSWMATPDQTMHPMCEAPTAKPDPAPDRHPLTAFPVQREAKWITKADGTADFVPSREQTPEWTEADDKAEEGQPFQGLAVLKASIARSRMNPLPRVPLEQRGEQPWVHITDRMGGEPDRWQADPACTECGEPRWIWVKPDPTPEKPKPARRMVQGPCTHGKLVIIDRNGSYPSAAGSVPLAPNKLLHTGALDAYDRTQAGIYLVDLPEWDTDRHGIPHPLGRIAHERAENQVWIATPHVRLLNAQVAAGRLAEPIVIRDSWTGRSNDSLFEHFTKEARKARTELVGTGEPYVQYKRSLSKALRLLWPDEARSPFWRPDWRTALVAEASVRHWVMASKAVRGGGELVALLNVDEAVYWTSDGKAPAPYVVGDMFGEIKIKTAQDPK